MAHQPSDKSRYKSVLTNRWLTKAQWLAEVMCSRQSKRETGEELTPNFWKTDRWKAEWKKQLIIANRLLKVYESAAISRALRSPEGLSIFSLGASFLLPLIQREQARITKKKENEQEQEAVPVLAISEYRALPAFAPKKSKKMKLDELE